MQAGGELAPICYRVANVQPASAVDAIRRTDARFVVAENGQYFEVVKPEPLECRSEQTQSVSEDRIFRVVGKVKRRTKVGRGWIEFDEVRKLSDIAIIEANRIGFDVPKRWDGVALRTHALRIVLQLARLAPKEVPKAFLAFRAERPDMTMASSDESFARDRFIERVKKRADDGGVRDPKPFEQLLDSLNAKGWISDRTLGEEWQHPDDPPLSPPREYVYRDRQRGDWSGRSLNKTNRARDEAKNPLREKAVASLKAAYQERRREGRNVTQGMIEAMYYGHLLSDIDHVGLGLQRRI